jgi:hypothetical protein
MDRKTEFDEKLQAIIEKVLKDSFGESATILHGWLRIQSVNPEEIPQKLNAFADALRTFSAGGSVLEILILKELYSSFGREFISTNKRLNFKDHIIELKNSLQLCAP